MPDSAAVTNSPPSPPHRPPPQRGVHPPGASPRRAGAAEPRFGLCGLPRTARRGPASALRANGEGSASGQSRPCCGEHAGCGGGRGACEVATPARAAPRAGAGPLGSFGNAPLTLVKACASFKSQRELQSSKRSWCTARDFVFNF